MHLEPVEIQHVKLRRSLIGYEREAVDKLLENVTASYEDVWFERGKLEGELASLRNRLDGQAQAKEALDGTVKVAQRTADDLLAEARSKADAIVDEAHERSLTTLHEARSEHQRLRVEIKKLEVAETEITLRLRSLLTAARELLDGHESIRDLASRGSEDASRGARPQYSEGASASNGVSHASLGDTVEPVFAAEDVDALDEEADLDERPDMLEELATSQHMSPHGPPASEPRLAGEELPEAELEPELEPGLGEPAVSPDSFEHVSNAPALDIPSASAPEAPVAAVPDAPSAALPEGSAALLPEAPNADQVEAATTGAPAAVAAAATALTSARAPEAAGAEGTPTEEADSPAAEGDDAPADETSDEGSPAVDQPHDAETETRIGPDPAVVTRALI